MLKVCRLHARYKRWAHKIQAPPQWRVEKLHPNGEWLWLIDVMWPYVSAEESYNSNPCIIMYNSSI